MRIKLYGELEAYFRELSEQTGTPVGTLVRDTLNSSIAANLPTKSKTSQLADIGNNDQAPRQAQAR
jgi:hypothetical protein